jgi:rod shape-determining protein MreD
MYWIRFSLVVLIATVLNAANVLNAIALGGYNIRPDLLLVLLLFFSSGAKPFDAIITSFAIGFAADISTETIGPYCLSFGLFGSLVSQLHGVVLMKRMTHQCLAIFVIGMCAGITAWGLNAFKTGQPNPNMFVILLGRSFYSAVLGPFIWVGFSAMSGWLGLRKFRTGRTIDR